MLTPFGGLDSAMLKLLFLHIVITLITYQTNQVRAFHLSFGHRLLRAANIPQLNPASTLIRPIECRNTNNHTEVGICMFSIDCMHNKGVPLSVCKHNYFVGTCCRLPDYNNFVGIVYDLRDTETNKILEARRVSAESSFTNQLFAAEESLKAIDQRKTNTSTTQTHSSTPSAITTNDTSKSSAKLEDKYVISSTSLFPFASALDSSTQSSSSPLLTGEPSSPARVPASAHESARNADGLPPVLIGNKPPLIQLVASELDSFHIQTAISNSTNAPTTQVDRQTAKFSSANGLDVTTESLKQNSYDIIKEDNLEVLNTISSAHSPPTQQQFSLVDHSPSELDQSKSQSSVYQILEEPVETSKSQASIVIANNHQSSFHSTEPTSGQTISSVSSLPTTAATSVASDKDTIASQNLLSNATTKLQGPSNLIESPASASSTPLAFVSSSTSVSSSSQQTGWSSLVELVRADSDPSRIQLTTPFTNSLSTAILPNVSSHPYSPTTPATILDQSPLVVLSKISTTAPWSQKPTPSESPLLAQLYSSSTSQQDYHNHQQQQLLHQTGSTSAHMSRPSLSGSSMLQATSKIVMAGSGTPNNLIPSFNGLPSALLSQIPFKIASGLSSYLQSAMKPSGLNNKPLLSSNTAPSLQHQQQMLLASTSSSNITKLSSAGGIRFPGSITSTTSTTPEASTPILGVSNWSGNLAVSSESPVLMRDVVKEALQVCGRPQMSSQVSQPIEGKKRVARIVGGNQSQYGQWPWMVSLRQWRKGAFLHKCGAALLNENWAITAAHCVENVKATDLLLRLGEFDVSNQDEPNPYTERRVKSVVSHPSFDPKTFEYDLALLRFSDPIKYERNILPVCVPPGNDSYVDRMATVIGWGRLYEDGPLPDVIQHVDVPIITNNECEKMYKNAGYIEEIPDMFICAGISKGGRDSCEGDSGGPLTMIDLDGRSYLVGIISWGIGCALPSQPGVYTRITAFSGWINQITAF